MSLASVIDAGSRALDGVRCPAPWGEPTDGAMIAGTRGVPLVDVVGVLKTENWAPWTHFEDYCPRPSGYGDHLM